MEPKDESLLEVHHLGKSYGDFYLQDVNFNVPAGTIVGVIGRNGTGKSTAMRAIMDLIKPDDGHIFVLGKPMPEEEIAVKEQVGYVGEVPLLNENWTLEETMRFARQFYPNWNQQAVEYYVKRFAIDRDKKIRELSKGMKMTASLILAMAHEPKLLLLDEPTSGLDPVVRTEILEMLLDFVQDEKRSILFSSHITPDVEKIADWIMILDEGELVLSEDKESLLDRYKRIVISGKYSGYAAEKPLLFNCQTTAGSYIGYTDCFSQFQRVAEGHWRAERLTLEELFVLLTGKKNS